MAKRRLCLGPTHVINCTPLSELSFWVSLFPGMRGYNRKTSCLWLKLYPDEHGIEANSRSCLSMTNLRDIRKTTLRKAWRISKCITLANMWKRREKKLMEGSGNERIRDFKNKGQERSCRHQREQKGFLEKKFCIICNCFACFSSMQYFLSMSPTLSPTLLSAPLWSFLWS